MSAGTRVIRHDSELGSWELVLRTPEPRLRALVREYEGYSESGSPASLRQQVPTAQLPVIVNFGSPWEIGATASGAREQYGSFLAGLGERSSYVAAAGSASCLQFNLTPLGAYMLLGLPLSELSNRVVPLEDVVPPVLRGLSERLEDAQTWEDRFALLETILLARMADARRPSRDVAWAWTMLERTHGNAPIGWICDRLGRSRRHLAARFREQVGLPPKTVARILRFERAVALLGVGESTLGEVALECGYYDQAHLNRDFREFAGAPPAAFARRIVPDGGVVVVA
jgi:AraC-like DNA-binding protein